MIRGRKTRLVFPVGIAVDDARAIYVADVRDNSIAVFAAGTAGNVAPARRIGGPHTGLNAPGGIAVDRVGNIYVANQNDGLSGGSVTVYASNADGDASPIQSISGPDTLLAAPTGVAVDNGRNIYVVNLGADQRDHNTVNVYRSGANGNVVPMQRITGMVTSAGIALDAMRDIYVAHDRNPGSVAEYPAGARGPGIPLRSIAGPTTKLGFPTGVAVRAGTMYVASSCCRHGGTVTVYPPGAHGNAEPTQTIRGAATEISDPYGIAVR